MDQFLNRMIKRIISPEKCTEPQKLERSVKNRVRSTLIYFNCSFLLWLLLRSYNPTAAAISNSAYKIIGFVDICWLVGYILQGLSTLASDEVSADLEGSTGQRVNLAFLKSISPNTCISLMTSTLITTAIFLLWTILRFASRLPIETDAYAGIVFLIVMLYLRHILAIVDNSILILEMRGERDELRKKSIDTLEYAARMEILANEHRASHEKLEISMQTLAEANTRLESLATTDGMTGLSNHRTFQEFLSIEKARADREGQALALLLLDVDYFKDFNDSYGHPAGDELLRILANLLKENVRTEDQVARYGGEEFAVILPKCPPDEAMKLAERLRSVIAIHSFPHSSVTVSIGVAYYPEQNEEFPNVVERADRALYVAKQSGRNRVAFSDEIYEEEVQKPTSLRRAPVCLDLDSNQTAIPKLCRRWGQLEGLVQQSSGQLLSQIHALIEMRNAETDGHSQRVARFALRLAREAADNGEICLDPGDLRELTYGALLHDIGKIALPMNLLMKQGPLDAVELELISKHPMLGVQLLEKFPLLAPALPVVRSHHERWDGLGFPDALQGEEIPLSARIIALTGAMDVMWTDQFQRKALPFSEVRVIIEKGAGSQFDPKLVRAFCRIEESEWKVLRQKDESDEVNYLNNRDFSIQEAA